MRRLRIKNGGTRKQIRRRLILRFLKEAHGNGTGELASRYRYNVERLKDGRWVYLKRPSQLNKGFDFVIYVERWADGKDKPPSHKDVLGDLRRKRRESRRKFRRLYGFMGRVYRLQEPDAILMRFATPRFKRGLSVECILKILKWMFIEQDMTYWNWSGRHMLKGAIDRLA